SMVVDPNIKVSADLDLTVDARVARPVTLTVPFTDAQPGFVTAGADITNMGVALADGEGGLQVFTGTTDAHQTSPFLHGEVIAEFTRPASGATNAPGLVDLAYKDNGRMFSGLTRNLKRSDLATVHADHASQGVASGFL